MIVVTIEVQHNLGSIEIKEVLPINTTVHVSADFVVDDLNKAVTRARARAEAAIRGKAKE